MSEMNKLDYATPEASSPTSKVVHYFAIISCGLLTIALAIVCIGMLASGPWFFAAFVLPSVILSGWGTVLFARALPKAFPRK